MHDDIPPTSDGLLRCLQALAEECASLNLTKTHIALQHAISVCSAERQQVPRAITIAAYARSVH